MIRNELFCYKRAPRAKTMLLAVGVASITLISPVFSQSPATSPASATSAAPVPNRAGTANAPTAKPAGAGSPIQYHATKTPEREVAYYSLYWGVDSFSVKAVESGELIRFSYRVVDPERAKPINDKKIEAFLIAPAARAKLVIPSLEKVGQLRQSSTPIAGNSYWMAFSNPGRPVKRGDRVNIEIGQFHVEGLVVQ